MAKHEEAGSIRASPDVQIKIRAGVLYTCAATLVGCAITCTAYVVRMEGKIDQSLEIGKQTAAVLEKIGPEHAILWNWYNRTASLGVPARAQP